MVQTCCCCGFCFRGWIESKPKFLQTSKSSPDLPRHIFTRRRRRKRAATCQFSQRLSFRSLFIGTEFDVFSFKVTINVPHPPHPTPQRVTPAVLSRFSSVIAREQQCAGLLSQFHLPVTREWIWESVTLPRAVTASCSNHSFNLTASLICAYFNPVYFPLSTWILRTS